MGDQQLLVESLISNHLALLYVGYAMKLSSNIWILIMHSSRIEAHPHIWGNCSDRKNSNHRIHHSSEMSVSAESLTYLIMHYPSEIDELMIMFLLLAAFCCLINVSQYLLFIRGVALGPLLSVMRPQTSESISSKPINMGEQSWKLVVGYRSVNNTEIAFHPTHFAPALLKLDGFQFVIVKWL